MPQMCCVFKCDSSLRRKKGGISFFHFPKNEIMRQQWIDAIQFKLMYKMNPGTRVCSKHFLESDYIFGGNIRKLKKAAVPSKYLGNTNKINEVLNLRTNTITNKKPKEEVNMTWSNQIVDNQNTDLIENEMEKENMSIDSIKVEIKEENEVVN